MSASRFTKIKKNFSEEVFGTGHRISFWEYRFLPRWLPLIVGGVLGIIAAVLISQQAWHYLIPLILAVPAVIVFNRHPFVAVILWLLFTQFYVNTAGPSGRFIFWILHRGMIPATLVIVIVADWFGVRKKEPVKFGRAELAILIFILSVLAGIFLLHPSPTRAIIKFYDRLFVPFCMYLLIRLLNPGEKDFRRILPVLFFVLIAQSVIGLMQWYAPQLLPPQWLEGNAGARTVGTFGNPAVYTTTLLFTLLMLLQYTFNSTSRWGRIFTLSAISLAILCIFFSFSRGSWLGGLIALTGVIILYPKKMLPLAILQIAIVASLSGTLFAAQIAYSWERLNSEETAEGRIVQNYASFRMIQLKPWFGWGWDNYDRYDRQFHTRIGTDIANIKDQTSHNTYLSMMAELGVITFLIYISPFFWWLWLSLKVRRKLPRTGFWSWTLIIMLWLLLLHHNIVSTFIDMIRFNPYGTTIFWMVLGLIASIVHQHQYLNTNDIALYTRTTPTGGSRSHKH